MFRITVFKGLLLAACLAVGSLALAADPSIDQIYKAANAGMFREANSLMAQVLRDHPQSGKAHFVQAELLAKQGQLLAARTELATAERLAPGLPFAKSDAVQSLTKQLNRTSSTRFDVPGLPNQGAGGPLLWQLMLAAVGVLIVGYFIFRRQSVSPATPYAMAGGAPVSASNLPVPPVVGAAGYGGAPAPWPASAPVTAPGLGSTLVSGLATGAAVGAGMVAGQALMHRMMDGSPASEHSRAPATGPVDPTPPYDMGGNQFGVADASSWDDAGASLDGGGEWN